MSEVEPHNQVEKPHGRSKSVQTKLKDSYLSIRELSPINTTKHAFPNKIFLRKAICILLKHCDSEKFYRTCVQTLLRGISTCSYFDRRHRFHTDLLNGKEWRRRWWWQESHIHAGHVYLTILMHWNSRHFFHIYLLFILKLWSGKFSSIVYYMPI